MGKTADKTVHKTMGWLGVGTGTAPASVDVKDGKIVRIRPFRYYDKYSKEEANAWKLEARGQVFDPGEQSFLSPLCYGYKKRIYSKNRIPYPLIREDWDPNGERHPETRGISKYKRISWDEATKIIASEIRRIQETYGPTALFIQGDGHGEEKNIGGGHGVSTRLMDLLGGYTLQGRQPDSWEGWYWGAKHAWGMDPVGKQANQTNLIKDISDNSDAVLFWGCDVETTPWGWGGQTASRICRFWKQIGIQSVYICPDLNYAAAVHATKWLPVLPNTDAALQLAIAYTWIKEGTFDQGYLDTHTVGFDHFKNYVMGGEDGIPKTPKWASEKCGVAVHHIKALARYWAKHNVSISHCNGGGFIRSVYSHEPARLEVTLLAMQALGHPGRNQVQMIEWGLFGNHELNPMPPAEYNTFMGGVFTGHNPGFGMDTFIPQTLVPDAIMCPEGETVNWYGHVVAGLPREDQFLPFHYPEEGKSRIHMFWTDTPCWSTCWNGGFRLQDALHDPSIEFVLVNHPWFENDTKFADMILPIATKFEEEDIITSTLCGVHDMVINERQAIEPVGEAVGDFDAILRIADEFGMRENLKRYVCGLGGYEKAGAGVLKYDEIAQDATKNALGEGEAEGDEIGEITIEKMKRMAWTIGGMDERYDYEDFIENDYYVIPTKKGWEDDPAGMIGFYEDPDSHPLQTPTGKIEIYATGIAEHWPDDRIRDVIPRWIEEDERHHERLTNDRGKDYPFLMMSNHPHFRIHAQHDDSVWLREIDMCKVTGPDGYKYEPVWVNTEDARARGLKSGDIVRIYNERGSVLGGVIVTERVMRSTISQDHGARVDAITLGTGGLDRGGANNLICPGNTTSENACGEVTNGFLVNIEKVDVFELAKQYPEEFNHPYDPADGCRVEGYIIEE